MNLTKHLAALVLSLALAPAASAQKPETYIPVYVTPYYEAAATADDTPKVKVGDSLNTLLQSSKPADIRAARDLIITKPEKITPMALMVLAIRMYDTGQRDEAVKWFYIGKYRAITLLDTIAFTRGPLSDGIHDAIGGFIELAGPYINGYAFCDIGKQKATNAAAIDWVEAHPYLTIYDSVLKSRSKPGGIELNLKRSIADIRASVVKEAEQMSDPAQLKSFQEARTANKMDARFCWAS